MKPNRHAWIANIWPLIDKRMSRSDCIAWLVRNGYIVPPKSACTFCPYASNERWRRQRDESPLEWAETIAFDEAIRYGLNGVDGRNSIFVHRQGVPLKEAVLEAPGQEDLFGNECEGHCGV